MKGQMQRAAGRAAALLLAAAVIGYTGVRVGATYFSQQLDGGFTLIGDTLEVGSLEDGGPAQRAGLKAYDTIVAIEELATNLDTDSPHLVTYMRSPQKTLAPNATLSLDLGIYAGPQDREVFSTAAPLEALSFKQLILYQMSSFCAICTFQWLAKFLLGFLDLVHMVSFDWGVAIIVLVLVVRTILHPITKKSQISMQRFGKQMQTLKPEMDKLQQRYKSDPKKLQAE